MVKHQHCLAAGISHSARMAWSCYLLVPSLNIEKVVHFFENSQKLSNNNLGLFHFFQTTNESFEKRNQHLSVSSYCDQSEIYEVTMNISRLIQILDRKCQFHLFDN